MGVKKILSRYVKIKSKLKSGFYKPEYNCLWELSKRRNVSE